VACYTPAAIGRRSGVPPASVAEGASSRSRWLPPVTGTADRGEDLCPSCGPCVGRSRRVACRVDGPNSTDDGRQWSRVFFWRRSSIGRKANVFEVLGCKKKIGGSGFHATCRARALSAWIATRSGRDRAGIGPRHLRARARVVRDVDPASRRLGISCHSRACVYVRAVLCPLAARETQPRTRQGLSRDTSRARDAWVLNTRRRARGYQATGGAALECIAIDRSQILNNYPALLYHRPNTPRPAPSPSPNPFTNFSSSRSRASSWRLFTSTSTSLPRRSIQ